MSEKTSTSFWIKLKPDGNLQSQRITKIPIHYRKELNDVLKTNWLNRKTNLWNNFSEFIDNQEREWFYQILLDSRHRKSNTDQYRNIWPPQRLAIQLATVKK